MSHLQINIVKTIKRIIAMEGYLGSISLKSHTEVETPLLDILYQTISKREDGKWLLRDIMPVKSLPDPSTLCAILSTIMLATPPG